MTPYGVIDAHVHIAPVRMMKPRAPERMRLRRPEFPVVIGFTEEVNAWVAEYTRHAPDRLLPCGSVDPRRSKDPASETERIITELGTRLIKVHPPHQLLYPNDYLNLSRPA